MSAYVCECSECVHVCECVCVVSIYVVNVQCEYLCSECVNVCVSVVGACVSVCVFTHHQPYIHILIVMPSTPMVWNHTCATSHHFIHDTGFSIKEHQSVDAHGSLSLNLKGMCVSVTCE